MKPTQNDIMNSLVMQSLKTNYVEFVEAWGYEQANENLTNLFGDVWKKRRQLVWQWYDREYNGVTQ